MLADLEERYTESRRLQAAVKTAYEGVLAFYGENLNSTNNGERSLLLGTVPVACLR